MSEDPIQIARAEDNDAADVARVLTEATQHKNTHGDQIWDKYDWTEEEALENIKNHNLFIVRVGCKLAGTVILDREDPRKWGQQPPTAGYIHKLAIRDEFRGKDLGQSVLEWADAEIAQDGGTALRLDCESSNTGLCRYYEGLGFVQIGTYSSADGNYTANLYERSTVHDNNNLN